MMTDIRDGETDDMEIAMELDARQELARRDAAEHSAMLEQQAIDELYGGMAVSQ